MDTPPLELQFQARKPLTDTTLLRVPCERDRVRRAARLRETEVQERNPSLIPRLNMVRSLTITLNSLAALVVVITSCISSNALLISPLPVKKSPFGVSNGVCRRESDSVVRRDLSFARPNTVMMATSGPAVLDRPTVEKKQEKAPVKDKRSMGNESWEVRIYNDGTNTREHVARCLVRVTGLTEIAAYGTMMQAHQHGIAVVGRWVFERAEMYYEALKQSGIICDLNPVDEER